MRVPPEGLCWVVGVLAAGCGDRLPYASSPLDGGRADTTGGAGGAGTGGATGGAGGGGGFGGGGAVATGVKVFTGVSSMLFDGPSCTADTTATGDRWCGFLALSSTGMRNLFVVDVSKVLAGVAVSCDGGDPHCLLLTPSLGGDSADPTLHGTFFQGDTLLYYDAALAPHAWRPGMAAGKRLVDVSATYDAVFCTPAPRGTAVVCLGLPADQPDLSLVHGDLLAGNADSPGPEPLLRVLDSVIVSNTADRDGIQRFSFGFPPGGNPDHIAWTSRATPDGPEVLKAQNARDTGPPLTVASDVHAWDVSADGTRWLWLRGIDDVGVGTLQTAAFPDGAGAIDILADVLDYGLPSQSGHAAVALTVAGTLSAIADPVNAPAAQLVLDTGVRTLLSFGTRAHLVYAKHVIGRNFVDVFVRKPDGTGACTVDDSATVPLSSVHFAADGDAMLWATRKTGGFDGHYTRLPDCDTVPLAPNVVALAAIGSRVIFMDAFDDTTRTGSMRFRSIAAGNTLDSGAPTLIADQVDTYAISGPAPGALVYTVSAGAGAPADGVYIRGLAP